MYSKLQIRTRHLTRDEERTSLSCHSRRVIPPSESATASSGGANDLCDLESSIALKLDKTNKWGVPFHVRNSGQVQRLDFITDKREDISVFGPLSKKIKYIESRAISARGDRKTRHCPIRF
jgi:hypothetical protein